MAGLSVGLGGAALLALLGSAARVRRTLRLQRSVSDDDDSSRQRSTATYVVLEIQVGLCACMCVMLSVPIVVPACGLGKQWTREGA